jgi:hypothetical protein
MANIEYSAINHLGNKTESEAAEESQPTPRLLY